MRCLHEKRVSGPSIFATFTYDDGQVPAGGTLVKRDVQLFLKKLRKAHGAGIRFFGCGEYGGHTLRPHYHLLLFNVDFSDKKFYKKARDGSDLYYSSQLEKLWGFGFCPFGDVTFDSACYVAGYVCDKVTGDKAAAHYGGRQPEFALMSRRPGIGKGYFAKFGGEVYAHDSVIINGREVRPPRFYDVEFEKVDPKRMAVLKRARRRAINRADNTSRRLGVREKVVALNLARNAKEQV
jgi:hypothetical protein